MILKIAEQVVKVVIQFLSNRMIQLLHHIDRHKKNYWMKTQYSVILSMITKQFSEYQRMNQKSVWLQMPNHSRDFFCMCSEKIMLYFYRKPLLYTRSMLFFVYLFINSNLPQIHWPWIITISQDQRPNHNKIPCKTTYHAHVSIYNTQYIFTTH